jgi:hypothetical protein
MFSSKFAFAAIAAASLIFSTSAEVGQPSATDNWILPRATMDTNDIKSAPRNSAKKTMSAQDTILQNAKEFKSGTKFNILHQQTNYSAVSSDKAYMVEETLMALKSAGKIDTSVLKEVGLSGYTTVKAQIEICNMAKRAAAETAYYICKAEKTAAYNADTTDYSIVKSAKATAVAKMEF